MRKIIMKNRNMSRVSYETDRRVEVVSREGAALRVVKIELTGEEREGLSISRPLSDIKVRKASSGSD